MADGTMFDAQFYAQTYVDVANAVGTDEAALYNHYVNHGKAEGRKAYADAATTDRILALKASYPEWAQVEACSPYQRREQYDVYSCQW